MNEGLYSAMLHAHSVGRWIVLLLLLIAIFRSIGAGNKNFTHADQRVGTLLTIFADIMLLVGIYLYFAGEMGYAQFDRYESTGELMGNSLSRFFAIEHTSMMLIAVILLHIGKAQGKKDLPHKTKHKRTAVYYILALLIIIAMIPWPFREMFSDRGWF